MPAALVHILGMNNIIHRFISINVFTVRHGISKEIGR
jgi:hypothetical protein